MGTICKKISWMLESSQLIHYYLYCERNHTWIFFCESLKVVWSSTWPLSKAIIQISNVLVFFSGKSIQSLTVSQSLSLSHFRDYWVLEFQAMYFICNYFTFFIFSKASRYMASSCTNLDNARFWIGSKKIKMHKFM